jgi:hypothetical protein
MGPAVFFKLWKFSFDSYLSIHPLWTPFLRPFSPLISKIELWELQRFLWIQYGSRLSDEFFDHITVCRQLCDPIDGTLSPAAFLDFTSRLLSCSSAGLTIRESRMWPMVLAGTRGAANTEKHNDIEDEGDIHSEVHTFAPT